MGNQPGFHAIELSRAEGVATLLLNQPASLNACTMEMLAELCAALDDLASDDEIRVVVLSGKGRLFCAGANLKEDPPEGTERLLLDHYLPVFQRLASLQKPVIAAVNGSAVGVGMSLALSCDLVLMAQDASFLSPFTQIGLVPDGGATWLLAHQLGLPRAYEIAISGKPVSAQRALELGLANRLAPADELMTAAVTWAQEISKSSAFALAQTKRLIRQAVTSSFEDAFRSEAVIQEECGKSEFSEQARRRIFEKSNRKLE